jgi:hypothetical protein
MPGPISFSLYRRRLPEILPKIGDRSRLLQPYFEKLIGPGMHAAAVDTLPVEFYPRGRTRAVGFVTGSISEYLVSVSNCSINVL